MIFVSYVELLYRLASDLALKTKYYSSTLFSIRNLSEIALFKKKRGQFLFCFDHAVAWDSSRTGPANIPHATVGSLLKCGKMRQNVKIKFNSTVKCLKSTSNCLMFIIVAFHCRVLRYLYFFFIFGVIPGSK